MRRHVLELEIVLKAGFLSITIMGDLFNSHTVTGPQVPLRTEVVGSYLDCAKRDHYFAGRQWFNKYFAVSAFFAGAITLLAVAVGQGYAFEQKVEAVEPGPGASTMAAPAVDKQKEIDFVLAEVRKQLEPNPETEVVQLSIDPDYRVTASTYLVNTVLDAHGREITLGVMVSVRHKAEGMQATFSYID